LPKSWQSAQKRFGAYWPRARSQSCKRGWLIRGFALFIMAIVGSVRADTLPQPAAIIIDAKSGQVIFEHNANAPRHPASLAKMMTLYLTFQAIGTDRISGTAPLPVSTHAAAQPRSKLGLKAGDTVSAPSAILALVTKSANDVAMVLAEAIAGGEAEFVARMNAQAHELGMDRTLFQNPTGLHDPAQITTAKDMIILARALMRDFPAEYAYFSVREFEHEGRIHTNHNRLLGNYTGTDGIKTGYVRAAGFHLAVSVHRQGQHVIGVIMGSPNAKARDLNMIYLLENAFSRLIADQGGDAEANPKIMMAGEMLTWSVQVGAFSEPSSAQQYGRSVAHLMIGLPTEATVSVVEINNQGRVLHRARVVGMTQKDAWRACAQLHAASMACLPVEPDGNFVTFN